jgi:hypothetical protein
MITDGVSERRSQRIMNQRYVRRCSFCRSPGHNITTCNSDRITEFELICASEVRNINIPDDFKNWLNENYSENPMLLKTFVIRKFGVTTRISISNSVDMITDYIFRRYKNNTRLHTREQTLMNDLRDLHNIETDDFENDLINFLTQLRNVNYREEREPQLYEIPNIERMIMRELFQYIFNNRVVDQREEQPENIKFNINLIHNNNDNDNDNENNTNNNMLENNMMCNICWDEKEKNKFVKFGCNHEFCKDCIVTSLRSEQRNIPCCALCRSEINNITCTTEDFRSELAEFIA